MQFNISNQQDQIKAILFYCKMSNIKINKRILINNRGFLTYNITSISKWYKFFDSIFVWGQTKEGYNYWFNHQLRLAYFALHFKLDYKEREKISFYIIDLLLRVRTENLDVELLTKIIEKLESGNIIEKNVLKK